MGIFDKLGLGRQEKNDNYTIPLRDLDGNVLIHSNGKVLTASLPKGCDLNTRAKNGKIFECNTDSGHFSSGNTPWDAINRCLPPHQQQGNFFRTGRGDPDTAGEPTIFTITYRDMNQQEKDADNLLEDS